MANLGDGRHGPYLGFLAKRHGGRRSFRWENRSWQQGCSQQGFGRASQGTGPWSLRRFFVSYATLTLLKTSRMAPFFARQQTTVFLTLWLFTIFVSVFDGYLALRHRDVLAVSELNPVGQLLLARCGGQVWYLLGAKFAGTVAVASLVLHIHEWRPQWSLPIVSAVAGSQLGLLLFLLLA